MLTSLPWPIKTMNSKHFLYSFFHSARMHSRSFISLSSVVVQWVFFYLFWFTDYSFFKCVPTLTSTLIRFQWCQSTNTASTPKPATAQLCTKAGLKVCPSSRVHPQHWMFVPYLLQHLKVLQRLGFNYWKIQNISYAFYFRIFRTWRLLYENIMHTKRSKQVRESAVVSVCTKFHAYERSEIPNIRKFSAYELFWIYGKHVSMQMILADIFLETREKRTAPRPIPFHPAG